MVSRIAKFAAARYRRLTASLHRNDYGENYDYEVDIPKNFTGFIKFFGEGSGFGGLIEGEFEIDGETLSIKQSWGDHIETWVNGVHHESPEFGWESGAIEKFFEENFLGHDVPRGSKADVVNDVVKNLTEIGDDDEHLDQLKSGEVVQG